jgi:hypothetical protein
MPALERALWLFVLPLVGTTLGVSLGLSVRRRN